ncbi:MAG: protein arginine kinase [Candidatus Ancaeobacter aquaticus]|nr:protein arginine kinase [Candidatus Ancaeobacter aquaticus]
MQLHILLNKTSEWVQGTGPDAEIVLTSRIRMARNIVDFPFPNRASLEQKEKMLDVAEKALSSLDAMQGSLFFRLNDIDAIDKQFLIERHLISKEHAVVQKGSAVSISDQEIYSVMLNEEDHFRMQVVKPGFQLDEVLDLINDLDDRLESKLQYAFHPQWGYLTACPTNIGTGMRASVMLHLPALVLAKQINQVLQAVVKLGLAVRGLYGEGTEAIGNLFQISNQSTLGKNEADILDNIKKIIKQIVGHEKNARQYLLKSQKKQVMDSVGRAYGVLKNAHILNSREAIELLSTLRLGVDLGIVTDIERMQINELMILTQPAHLQKVAGKELDHTERDIVRSELIRERLT